MFTGLIEDVGSIVQVQPKDNGLLMVIESEIISSDLKIGDSVSVDGACLTVTKLLPPRFTVEAVEETVTRTTIENITINSKVNLECSMQLGDRLGGHFVQGHVDGTGTISRIEKRGSTVWIDIAIPPEYNRFVIFKGSIAIDGISLTVAKKQDNTISISVIPHTYENTSLQFKKTGQFVNLEFDIIAKYLENLYISKESQLQQNKSKITEDWLKEQGFT